MNYNWDEFTKEDYEKIEVFDDEFVGKVRCGELCFDVIIRNYDEYGYAFSFDCYVANEDTGYGYTIEGVPYDYADGTDYFFFCEPYEEFVKNIERELTRFIEWRDTCLGIDYSLKEKANKPLFKF